MPGPESVTFTTTNNLGLGGMERFDVPTGGVDLVAGGSYVFFLSNSGLFDGNASTGAVAFMGEFAPDVYTAGEFVAIDNQQDTSQWNTAAWTKYFPGKDLAFTLSFTPVPEPATTGLLLLGVDWAGQLAYLLASGVFLVVVGAIVRRQPSPAIVVGAAGAALWVSGCLVWILSGVGDAVGAWMGFLLLTILGERLELSRLAPQTKVGASLFLGSCGLALAGLIADARFLALGHPRRRGVGPHRARRARQVGRDQHAARDPRH